MFHRIIRFGMVMVWWSFVLGVGWIRCTGVSHAKSISAGAAPVFSVAGGVYTSPVSVRLQSSMAGGMVRYTLDGSEPTSSSPSYSSPIQISNSTVLKAKVFGTGAPSTAVAQTYILASPDLAEFGSNLPLIILNTFGQSIPHNQRVQASVRFIDAQDGRCKLVGPAQFDGRASLNIRGNTSLRYPKRSFHIKFADPEGKPWKVELLGMPQESDWVLYGPYPDKTLMRDALAYDLSNQIGRYAPRTRFVEVFVNESGGPLTSHHYVGVYVFMEKVKRDKNRVNIQKLDSQDNAEPAITGGYIFKKDHTDQVELSEGLIAGSDRPVRKQLTFTSSQGNHFFYVEPDSDEITPAQRNWLRQYVNNFERTLYGDQFKDPRAGYAAYLDVDSFIDHHWLVEFSKNIDGYRFSAFYYKDRGGKLHMGPIWDWNLSFGNAEPREGHNPQGWYWPQLDDQQYSWFRRLFEDPDFAQKYIDRWGQLRQTHFAVPAIHARIDQWAKLLGEAQTRNFQRWRILGRSIHPNAYVGRTYEDEVAWMKKWVQQRFDWIDRQFVAGPEFSRKAGSISAGSQVELQAPAGKIYYTLDGSDPRAPGGAVSPKAQSYRSPLVLNATSIVFARVYLDRRWSYPAVARFNVGTGTGGP
jgi:hypothetical protein